MSVARHIGAGGVTAGAWGDAMVYRGEGTVRDIAVDGDYIRFTFNGTEERFPATDFDPTIREGDRAVITGGTNAPIPGERYVSFRNIRRVEPPPNPLGGQLIPGPGLDLSGMAIADADLALLAGCSKLNVLDLSSTPITDAGIAHLAPCAISACSVSPAPR